ncbi:MAG: DNA-protecting protein DprA [Coprobacillus sp.]|nr:DNA-protecting protein DprA [Coprobacillus sp.]
MEELTLYFSLKYEGDFQSIYNALLKKERVDEQLKHQLLKEIKCKYTTIFSDDYPETLKQINCPPFVLYYYGDLSLVNTKTIAVVGMRDPNIYGEQVTKYFVEGLVNQEYTIVSGMARGIDGIAHQCAIDNCGKTIAVLGTGIEYCYPLRHKELYTELKNNHLVISEYPFHVSPKRKLFPFRNRIIAGLSKNILITQAREKSGTMITAGYALEQGKDVLAVPSGINDYDGCNSLIQQGAKLVIRIDDIVEDEDFG